MIEAGELLLWKRSATPRGFAGKRACHPLESNQNLPGFSRVRRPSTQEWHRCDRATCRDRVIIIDYSVVIRPVLAVSLASHCERYCSGDRRFTRDAVSVQFREKDSNLRSEFQRLASYR